MSIREQFEAIKREFAEFRTGARQVHPTIEDPGARELLGQLLPALDQAFANLETTLPQGLDALEGQLAHCDKQHQEIAQALDELERQLAEPSAPAAASEEPSLPTGHGQKLRAEILGRFGEQAPVAAEVVGDSVASAWQDPSASASQEQSATDAPAARPAAPDQKKKPSGPDEDKELWEGISTVED